MQFLISVGLLSLEFERLHQFFRFNFRSYESVANENRQHLRNQDFAQNLFLLSLG